MFISSSLLLMIAAFAVYFLVLASISLIFYKKNQTADNFLLADRSLNYWVTALSAQTSDMGSWLFLAYPALVYAAGIEHVWTALGLVIFMTINWLVIAPALRSQTAYYKAETLTEFFEKKLKSNSSLAIASGIISFYFFVIYIASGLAGIGKIFQNTFDIPLFWGTIIGISITALYSILGGFLAISWSNLFQGFFLLIIILVVPLVSYFNLPLGFQSILNTAASKNIPMQINFNFFSHISSFLKLFLGFGIGYFGQPHILINFMGIDNVKNLKKAALVGIGWQTIVLSCAILTGLVGIPLIQNCEPEHLFIELAQKIFNPFFVGLTLCAIIAATLSTINTQLLVTATAFSETFISKFAPKYRLLSSTKYWMVLTSFFALIIANLYQNSLYDFVLYAWSGLGSSFGPAVLMTLYWKSFNKRGALVSMITGALVSGLWPFLNNSISPLIPGFIFSLIFGFLATIFYKAKR